MKKVIILYSIILMLFAIIGCNKDEDNSDNNPTPENRIVAEINGKKWEAASTGCFPLTPGNSMIIEGEDIPGNIVKMIMPRPVMPGTYEFKTFGTYQCFYRDSLSELYSTKNGMLTILKHDTTIKLIQGTFHWDASNDSINLSFTNGEFYIEYNF